MGERGGEKGRGEEEDMRNMGERRGEERRGEERRGEERPFWKGASGPACCSKNEVAIVAEQKILHGSGIASYGCQHNLTVALHGRIEESQGCARPGHDCQRVRTTSPINYTEKRVQTPRQKNSSEIFRKKLVRTGSIETSGSRPPITHPRERGGEQGERGREGERVSEGESDGEKGEGKGRGDEEDIRKTRRGEERKGGERRGEGRR